jgi:hypothetical protein
MFWDPEVESPATIAVIGCGPIGIEAALYGRFLGYDVDLFDARRPAHEMVRWNRRSIGVPVSGCTTSLGISALEGQLPEYKKPSMDAVWSGAEFADEYLLPIAKSDLIIDGIHINSRVDEVSRVRYYREEIADWQERANDEFRLLIDSRDRGPYTARADVVLDCRGMYAESEGYGPGGSQAAGAAKVYPQIHRWLPGDPRFENRMLDSKHVVVFGNSELAVRFVEEWATLFRNADDQVPSEAISQQSLSGKPLSGRLTWIVPSGRASLQSVEFTDIERWKRAMLSATSVIPSRGIEKIDFDEATETWRLQIANDDDSTIDFEADVFAPFANLLPTTSIGPTLYCDQWVLSNEPNSQSSIPQDERFYEGWKGWACATGEPNYYRLGAHEQPFSASGLVEGFQQIKDVFALLGTREDLDLYKILRKPGV